MSVCFVCFKLRAQGKEFNFRAYTSLCKNKIFRARSQACCKKGSILGRLELQALHLLQLSRREKCESVCLVCL